MSTNTLPPSSSIKREDAIPGASTTTERQSAPSPSPHPTFEPPADPDSPWLQPLDLRLTTPARALTILDTALARSLKRARSDSPDNRAYKLPQPKDGLPRMVGEELQRTPVKVGYEMGEGEEWVSGEGMEELFGGLEEAPGEAGVGAGGAGDEPFAELYDGKD